MDNEEEEKENLEFSEYALPSRMEKNFYRSICLKERMLWRRNCQKKIIILRWFSLIILYLFFNIKN